MTSPYLYGQILTSDFSLSPIGISSRRGSSSCRHDVHSNLGCAKAYQGRWKQQSRIGDTMVTCIESPQLHTAQFCTRIKLMALIAAIFRQRHQGQEKIRIMYNGHHV